jgi:hypothetical protein
MKLLKPLKFHEFPREEKKQPEPVIIPTTVVQKQAEKTRCCGCF